MNIYVGNLPFSVDDDGLREMFEAFGEVTSTSVINDKITGRSRGDGTPGFHGIHGPGGGI